MRGRYNTFERGSIYWTPELGAHPVWGAIRGKWEGLGWEGGKLGFPAGDELTNQDGLGKRQRFEGGTVYWHPVYGAHPVLGRIGELWAEYGWEGGSFGYPTSDEEPQPQLNGVAQSFARHDVNLFWSSGLGGDNNGTCTGECVGYQALSSAPWVKKTYVGKALGNGDVDVHVFPTDLGFQKAKDSYDRLWDEAFATVPYPKGMTAAQGSSMYTQLACHARYVFKMPNGEWNTHESWDMESNRPDVSWDYAMNPLAWPLHKCNWS